MKRIITSILLVVLVVSMTSCASYVSYKSSEREIVGESVIASGDEAAIKAWRSGDAAGIGVDVLATEALAKHPIRQLGAAVLDAGLIYGIKEGVEYLADRNSNRGDINVSVTSGGDSSVTVSGDQDNDVITSTDDHSGDGNNRNK